MSCLELSDGDNGRETFLRHSRDRSRTLHRYVLFMRYMLVCEVSSCGLLIPRLAQSTIGAVGETPGLNIGDEHLTQFI